MINTLLRVFILFGDLLFFLALFALGSDFAISTVSSDNIYYSTNDFNDPKVVLVLGAAEKNGKFNNYYFTYRIQAAADLYRAGRVKHFILSGDNHISNYNEPKDMKRRLMALGVPEEIITLDYAGFRTLDSVVRAKKVFQQNDLIIISQPFHLKRALFLAEMHDINASGYAANDPPTAYSSYNSFREVLARSKAVLDVFLLSKKPHFLGPKIDL